MGSTSSSFPSGLADRYEFERELGEGGMAIVYLARDRRYGSQVAVKVLKPELVAAFGASRFTREVRVTAGLQHPNILPLLDSGEADGLPYYVSPFVSGGSLAERLQRDGALAAGDAVRLVAEIADGLAYAHAKGLIHRDIKPANILLSSQHALLADFGVARVLHGEHPNEPITDSGLALGTAAYMAPEHAAGERVDARADIYALGCVLYELLTGSPPFTGATQRAVMARHAMDPVPSVRTVRPDVHPMLEAAIHQAMAKVPGARFPNVEAFRQAILDAAALPHSGAAIPALPPPALIAMDTSGAILRTAGGQTLAPASRGRRAWLAAAAVVVAIGGILVMRRSDAATLDRDRIMVYPLVMPADAPLPQTTGEDVATMLGSVMDGAGALRWIDGWQLLSPSQREDMRRVSDAEAIGVARAQRCRYVLTGRLAMRRGDSVEVLLTLRDIGRDSVLARPRAVALASEVWRGGLRAVNGLLVHLIPGAAGSLLERWEDRDPQAVANFLAGEAAFRRLQVPQALAAFKAAVAADSSFGWAAARGAQVASWAHEFDDASALARVAIAHVRTPHDQAFAMGLRAYVEGDAEGAITALRRATQLRPSMAVAWAQLGETFVHLLPRVGAPDSLAAEAFRRASALDSTSVNLLFHQTELAARFGDVARTDALARRFLAAARDERLRAEIEIIAACVRGATDSASWNRLAAERPAALILAAKSLGSAHVRCTRGALRALLAVDTAAAEASAGRRYFALVLLQQLEVLAGRPDSAVASIDAHVARWNEGTALFLMQAPIVEAMVPRARRVIADDAVRFGPALEKHPVVFRIWAGALFAASEGRLGVAESAAAEVRRRAQRSASHLDSLYARSVLAHVTLARGDTLAAIQQLDSLLALPAQEQLVSWEEGAGRAYDRLVLARLLAARGQWERARAVAQVLESPAPAMFPIFAGAAMPLRREAAKALGLTAEGEALQRVQDRWRQ